MTALQAWVFSLLLSYSLTLYLFIMGKSSVLCGIHINNIYIFTPEK